MTKDFSTSLSIYFSSLMSCLDLHLLTIVILQYKLDSTQIPIISVAMSNFELSYVFQNILASHIPLDSLESRYNSIRSITALMFIKIKDDIYYIHLEPVCVKYIYFMNTSSSEILMATLQINEIMQQFLNSVISI